MTTTSAHLYKTVLQLFSYSFILHGPVIHRYFQVPTKKATKAIYIIPLLPIAYCPTTSSPCLSSSLRVDKAYACSTMSYVAVPCWMSSCLARQLKTPYKAHLRSDDNKKEKFEGVKHHRIRSTEEKDLRKMLIWCFSFYFFNNI